VDNGYSSVVLLTNAADFTGEHQFAATLQCVNRSADRPVRLGAVGRFAGGSDDPRSFRPFAAPRSAAPAGAPTSWSAYDG